MSEPNSALQALRQEIDGLDNQIHDLIMARAALVKKIGAAKGLDTSRIAMRPGREAMVVRRLLARHSGPLPPAVVARIWREMIGAFCRLQGPMALAVLAPDKSVGYCDMARRHFGSSLPLSLHRSATQVLETLAKVNGGVAVMPWPSDGEAAPWWPQLATAEQAPSVIARLPFAPAGEGRFETLSALVVGETAPEPSGDDETLFVATLLEPNSRGRVLDCFTKAGFQCQAVAMHPQRDGRALHLISVSGFIECDDPRLAAVIAASGSAIGRIKRLGAYALPISESRTTE